MKSEPIFCTPNNSPGRANLEMRTKRLRQLLDLSAPKQLVASEISLIFDAAMSYCPKEMGTAFSGWLNSRHRKGC